MRLRHDATQAAIGRKAVTIVIPQVLETHQTFALNLRPAAGILDMDGCLTECIPGLFMNWDDIAESTHIMNASPPNHPLLNLTRVLLGSRRLTVIVMTARPERYRLITVEWLQRYGVVPDFLLMRANDDVRPDKEVKRSHLVAIREHHDIWFSVEDRAGVVKMWREEGITCLQCAEGNY
jgi:hypothetical protein